VPKAAVPQMDRLVSMLSTAAEAVVLVERVLLLEGEAVRYSVLVVALVVVVE
tara:strand:- start:359 stop:514 length:156 start_codon:yes stop_codon:yes gene_type:complete